MSGEYGTELGRPHFHACLFGINFNDRTPWRKNTNSDQLYRSATLERLWKHGNSEIGAVTFQSAAYVARYIVAKVTGDRATSHYTYITTDGEILQRTPEFNRMSLRPGIGAEWFKRYSTDVFPTDQVIINGHATTPPRYYEKLHARTHELELELVKQKRLSKINRQDNTPRRLAAKETVQLARATHLKRTLS